MTACPREQETIPQGPWIVPSLGIKQSAFHVSPQGENIYLQEPTGEEFADTPRAPFEKIPRALP